MGRTRSFCGYVPTTLLVHRESAAHNAKPCAIESFLSGAKRGGRLAAAFGLRHVRALPDPDRPRRRPAGLAPAAAALKEQPKGRGTLLIACRCQLCWRRREFVGCGV